ncbi:MAG TPA: hypothetical protein VJ574_07575 [Candidatus Bathyarchaeia archaeon]|nr:hypothetical protein [Candidatus Bathyarchaeia archaeon]
MPRDKIVLAALVSLMAISVLLSLAGVRAGDAGGGGGHNIIMPFL